MSAQFYDYVRGRTDALPEGHSEPGMRLYRHLVRLGASQAVEAEFPELRRALDDEAWDALIAAFVRDSTWTSPHYSDLAAEFAAFVERARDG